MGNLVIMNKRLVWNFEIETNHPLQIPALHTIDTCAERWESRYFWPDSAAISLNRLDDTFLELSRYKVKHRQDTYCVLPDCDYNIKRREDQLLFKPIIMKTAQAIAFGKKVNLEEPGSVDISLSRIQQHATFIEVEKEALIYRFATTPTLKLELARLRIAHATYFSLNIEAHSNALVTSIAQQIIVNQQPCDYVTFLKGLTHK